MGKPEFTMSKYATQKDLYVAKSQYYEALTANLIKAAEDYIEAVDDLLRHGSIFFEETKEKEEALQAAIKEAK